MTSPSLSAPRTWLTGLALPVLLCGMAAAQMADRNVELRHECITLDPNLARNESCYRLISDTHESMMRIGPNGMPEPGIAKSWEITPDRLVFHLHTGRRWSDGAPVVAEDFAMAWRRIMAMDPGSAPNPFRRFLSRLRGFDACRTPEVPGCVAGLQVVDDHTLVLDFDEVDRLFPMRTLNAPLAPVPSHFVRRHGDAWLYHPDRPFNGAYVIANMAGITPDTVTTRPIELVPNLLHPDITATSLPRATYRFNPKTYTGKNIREIVQEPVPPHIIHGVEDIPDAARHFLGLHGWKLTSQKSLLSSMLLVNANRVSPVLLEYLKISIIHDNLTKRVPNYGGRKQIVRLYNNPDVETAFDNRFTDENCRDCTARRAELRRILGITDTQHLRMRLNLTPNFPEQHREPVRLLFHSIGITLEFTQDVSFYPGAATWDMLWLTWFISLPDPSGMLVIPSWAPFPVLTPPQQAEFERLQNPAGGFQSDGQRLEDLVRAEEYLVNEGGIIPLYAPEAYVVFSGALCGVTGSSSRLTPLVWIRYCRHAAGLPLTADPRSQTP